MKSGRISRKINPDGSFETTFKENESISKDSITLDEYNPDTESESGDTVTISSFVDRIEYKSQESNINEHKKSNLSKAVNNRGAIAGMICVLVLAVGFPCIHLTQEDGCPRVEFNCRKDGFIAGLNKISSKIDLPIKSRDFIRRNIIASVYEQLENPPLQPLVILFIIQPAERKRLGEVSFHTFLDEVIRLPRDQEYTRFSHSEVDTTVGLENALHSSFSKEMSVIIDGLDKIDASVALGLYQLDDNAPMEYKNKTVLLVFESADPIIESTKMKTDAIVTKLLSDWISKDKSIDIAENRGLISRIANIPIIFK